MKTNDTGRRTGSRGKSSANTLTLHINERCVFNCAHCVMGFTGSYHGGKSRLTPAMVRAMIRAIDPARYGTVLLAGGEPSLDPQLVAAGIDECRRTGLISNIVSAPHWARTGASAEKFLASIPGLDDLTLSYDRYHLKFLSFEHYRNAARKASERGIAVTAHLIYISGEDLRQGLKALEPLKKHLTAIYGVPVVSAGNAAAELDPGRELTRIMSAGDLARFPRVCVAGAPLLDYRFNVHGCCFDAIAEASSPISLPPRRGEDIRSRLRRLEELPLVRSLSKYGFLDSLPPEGRKYLANKVKGRSYSSECDLCLEMMREKNERLWAYAAAGPGPGRKVRTAASWVLWQRGR